jgi:hypothetical protein
MADTHRWLIVKVLVVEFPCHVCDTLLDDWKGVLHEHLGVLTVPVRDQTCEVSTEERLFNTKFNETTIGKNLRLHELRNHVQESSANLDILSPVDTAHQILLVSACKKDQKRSKIG